METHTPTPFSQAMGGTGGYEYRFCPHCGTLMDLPSTGSLMHCPLCQADARLDPSSGSCSVETVSGPQDLLRRHGVEPLVPLPVDTRSNASAAGGRRERAKVNETCPKCGNKEMEYYTMQLRSADEGQTVFYECAKCKHKYSLNT